MKKTTSCVIKMMLLTSLISLSGCKEPTKDELLNDAELASAWKRKCENFKERAGEHEGCLNLHKAEVDESFGLLVRILNKNKS
ncbi:EexN family lipoprotein [Pseudomonas nitroreducens]|uniref:EexN family lipoprotein n=1 Tax=Pseudomonas nitroreducens TaxID=46680 RepID=UPI001472BF95|nr:EexN family lipoprotein [Pseudomonas nitroreducens]MDG9856951.1 EexN family lipoprotein [Pseudomonas nitroreducens]MDH1075791.1 EexN family lipoprotein [Pseudomonas nitroreducens]NMZ76402.1 EexN family lipoprotein [Pseudomonas nitroreducens]